MIECNLNGHNYATEKLYFADMKKLGAIFEEKVYPLFIAFYLIHKKEDYNNELFLSLQPALTKLMTREDMEYITELTLNREHLLIDGKRPDNAEWEKHWQSVGFMDYRTVAFKFMVDNLGNFTSLLTLIPQEWATELNLKEKFSMLYNHLNQLSLL